MDPDGAAAELPAVEGEVVLQRPRPTGRVVGRRLEPGRRSGRDEQRLVLGHARR